MKILMWVIGVPVVSVIALLLLGMAVATPESDLMHDAKRAVERQLRDGGSAEYRNLAVYKFADGEVICGEVNAKNGFGGMAGYTRFFYRGGGIAILEQPGSGPNMGGVWAAEGCDGSKGSAYHRW